MTKYNVTAEELFVILLIFYAQEGHSEYLTRYYSQVSPERNLRSVLTSLQEKGIINKTFKIPEPGTTFRPEDVDFNKTALKQFMQHSQDMGLELFMEYPPTISIDGREFSLRNIAKNFQSMDDFCFAYGKLIKFDPEMHAHVMELLRWGIEENLINSGIVDFVISMKWLELQQLRDKGDYNLNNSDRVL